MCSFVFTKTIELLREALLFPIFPGGNDHLLQGPIFVMSAAGEQNGLQDYTKDCPSFMCSLSNFLTVTQITHNLHIGADSLHISKTSDEKRGGGGGRRRFGYQPERCIYR